MKVKDKEFTPVVDKDGVYEIDLYNLFNEMFDDQPWLVMASDCIYMIKNVINDDCYIGQAKDFYGRFVSNTRSHYNSYLAALNGGGYEVHKAMKDFGLHNFKVYVVEDNIPLKERLLEEIYFIEYFDSYNNGYNGTTGGDHCEQIQSEEAQELARINSKITKGINSIQGRIDYLKSEGYDINYYTYRMFSGTKNFTNQHLPCILDEIDLLRDDYRWTPEMENIFSQYEKDNIPNVKSINCIVEAISWRLQYLKDNDLELNIHNYLIEIPIKKANISHIYSVIDNLDYLKLDPRLSRDYIDMIDELNAPTWDEVTDKIYNVK